MVQLDTLEKYNTALKIRQQEESHPLQMQVIDTQ